MYNSERFKLGIVTLPSVVLPSPEDVCSAIEETPIEAVDVPRAESTIHRHSVDSVVLDTDHDSDPYCHFQYRVAFSGRETGRSSSQTLSGVQPWHVRSRAFYFANGQFAVQPARGLSETWFPSFLARLTDTLVGDEFRIYGTECGSTDTPRTHGVSQPNDSADRVPAGDGSASFVSSAASDNRSPSSGGDPADLLAEATQTGVVGAQRTLSGVPSDLSCAPDTVVATWDETDWSNDANKAKRAAEIHQQIIPYLRSHV